MMCAASNEISPAIKALPVASSRRRARPVITSSPARPDERPQPCRKNAAVDEYPASAAPSTASSIPASRASSPCTWSANVARSRTCPSKVTASADPGPRVAKAARTSSRAVIPGEHIIESSHGGLTLWICDRLSPGRPGSAGVQAAPVRLHAPSRAALRRPGRPFRVTPRLSQPAGTPAPSPTWPGLVPRRGWSCRSQAGTPSAHPPASGSCPMPGHVRRPSPAGTGRPG